MDSMCLSGSLRHVLRFSILACVEKCGRCCGKSKLKARSVCLSELRRLLKVFYSQDKKFTNVGIKGGDVVVDGLSVVTGSNR